ncbi:MerR family transcriptional regulator [Anaerosalibacter bizertensis]|uniref:MerR family transcriptional regulator n=1 Tax=Anaerosalibacter bizertensis TaxID=932217 RepID=A0A844FG35_9FIRM|nr:MerR family transcriptional regulator [Anaerosalibacter bizertensis]MBV1818476.1 MerR family transcriptional regulator [Bacteroidales bacterium MSK.15.36]MBU5293216.1 MerR family transcriptional regulator [Anaerosalibacter bizertensis]MCB5559694.1 MerR family transcriptional regulator [Anaerosalibacter bizertensis]MCG4564285.1 MerR family transcriptional regulator [Anaerosalibacter bizertensis]MCG4582810.1 MerR family transcriptional regulator [Anaerosalibacter bizertensis]
MADIDLEKEHTISEVSKITDYPPHVLRYYEKEFELDIPRNDSNHRYYTYKEIELLQYIKSLQEKGFSNKQIKLIIKSPEILANNQEEAVTTTTYGLQKIDVNNLSQEISNELSQVITSKLTEEIKVILNFNQENGDKLIMGLKNEIEQLRKELTSKERDVLICENAKLKLKVKEKSYEVAGLKEKVKRMESSNKGFFKKIFGSKKI